MTSREKICFQEAALMGHPPFPQDYARQARLFRQGRERWKRRCAAKQDQIRALRVRIRDLEASRARWKQAALRNRSQRQPTTTALPEPNLGGAKARRPS
jgi:hypothetical protein